MTGTFAQVGFGFVALIGLLFLTQFVRAGPCVAKPEKVKDPKTLEPPIESAWMRRKSTPKRML